MTKLLFVGDVHAVSHELDDCARLMEYVEKIALENGLPHVVLSGDIYNNHGVIDAEVQRFWMETINRFRAEGITTIIIEGNHDRPGTNGTRASALLAHEHHAIVVRQPTEMFNILFLPYMTNEKVIEACNAHPNTKVVFCHATFDGARYENGFLAPDGIAVDAIPQQTVVGGHIHTPSAFSKVWYPGAPRWRSKADANVDRAVWLLEYHDDGRTHNMTGFDTSKVCKKIWHLTDSEAEPLKAFDPNPAHDYRIDVVGSREWVEERSALYRGKARVRPVLTDSKKRVAIKESEGIAVAFQKWIDSFKPTFGTAPDILMKLSRERLHAVAV